MMLPLRMLADGQLAGRLAINTLIPSVFRDASRLTFDSPAAFAWPCVWRSRCVEKILFTEVVTGGRFFGLWCNFSAAFLSPKKAFVMH